MMIKFTLFLALAALLGDDIVQGYTYQGSLSPDGDCDLEAQGFGRIAVGQTAYNNETCEEVHCSKGGFVGYGCGSVAYDTENCELVRGKGQYPDCCPNVECNGADEI